MKTIQAGVVQIQLFTKRAVIVKKITLGTCLALCTALSFAQEVNMYTGCNMVLSGSIYVVVNNTAFKNNGSFTAGTGTVVFTGNTDTSIAYVSGSSTTSFYNLTVDKSAYGIALKSAVGVKNVLTLSAGVLYSNTKLTLLSDINNTARLAVVPAGAAISGTTMVERYIPATRAWRLMTAPVTNAATIYNSWQNAGVYTVGKGLLVSAPPGGNGLDNTNASSLKTWDVASQAFTAVTNTNTSISKTNTGTADNTGYFIFIRGDRNLSNFTAPNTNITTVTSIGNLQTGTQVFSASSVSGGYTLIGNPYASPIDFNAVTRTNLLKRFYVWDPTLNVLGGYVTLDDLDNNGVYSSSSSGSAQTKEIQSSQAFFVETSSNGAASLTINESAKSTTNNLGVFRPTSEPSSGAIESLRANIFLLNANNTIQFADGTLCEFGAGYNEKVTNEDAIKFGNVNETLSLLRYGVSLAIERRPLINSNDTLFLKLTKSSKRNYQLQFIPENIDHPELTAYVEDSYLATSAPVSLSDTTAINFTIDNNAASAVANRFKIVFKQLTVLPVTFTAVKAFHANENIQVDWQVEDEINTVKYEVEKSADGSNFNLANTTNIHAGAYSWIDRAPFKGDNFYRIKSVDRDGSIKYSRVVHVLTGEQATNFTIYPNPVKGNSIHLKFANQPKGLYHFNLINSLGQSILSTRLPISNSSTSQTLKSNKALPAGLYQLQITGPANNSETQKVIIHQ